MEPESNGTNGYAFGTDAQSQVLLNDCFSQVLQSIIGYLPVEDVCTASAVCKQWYKVANSDHIWKKICQKENVPLEGGDQHSYRDFKTMYCRYSAVRKKWLTGNAVKRTEMDLMDPANGSNFIGTCVGIISSQIFLRRAPTNRSRDYNIYVFSTENGQYMHQLRGHNSFVYQLFLSNDEQTVVTTASNITVFNVNSGQRLYTVNHHNRCYVYDNVLVCNSGSNNQTSFVCDLSTGDKIAEHDEIIRSCDVQGTNMAIAVPGYIRVFDTNTWISRVSIVIPDNDSIVGILLRFDQRLLIGLSGSKIRWWDIDTGAVKETYNISTINTENSFRAEDDNLYHIKFTDSNGHRHISVIVYDMYTGVVLHTIIGSAIRVGSYWCEAHPVLSNGILVVKYGPAMSKGYISIWDTKKKIHVRDFIENLDGNITVWQVTKNTLHYIVQSDSRINYVVHKFDP